MQLAGLNERQGRVVVKSMCSGVRHTHVTHSPVRPTLTSKNTHSECLLWAQPCTEKRKLGSPYTHHLTSFIIQLQFSQLKNYYNNIIGLFGELNPLYLAEYLARAN